MNTEQVIALAEELSEAYSHHDDYGTMRYMKPHGENAEGLYRSVLIRDNYAFKAVKHAQYMDCQAEWDFHQLTTDYIRERLASPIYLSANGRVIVVKKARMLDPCKIEDEHGILLRQLEKELRDASNEAYRYDYFCDFGWNNVGFTTDGRLVMVDWGNILHTIQDRGNEDHRDTYSREQLEEQLGEWQKARKKLQQRSQSGVY